MEHVADARARIRSYKVVSMKAQPRTCMHVSTCVDLESPYSTSSRRYFLLLSSIMWRSQKTA